MFGDSTDIPVVQVSLPGEVPEEIDATKSGALGKALSAVRDQGFTLVCIGQPLTRPDEDDIDDFDAGDYMDAVWEAGHSDDPLKAVLELQEHEVFPNIPFKPDYLPLVVAAGAVRPGEKGTGIDGGSEAEMYWGERISDGHEGPMGWAIFEWK